MACTDRSVTAFRKTASACEAQPLWLVFAAFIYQDAGAALKARLMGPIVDVLMVGAGIFGAAGALEVVQRGHSVQLIDPGPLPHSLASSTDISKVIRMDYGADDFYMRQMELALD